MLEVTKRLRNFNATDTLLLHKFVFMDYISGTMPKGPDTIRKEVHLMPDVIKVLQEIADGEKRSLKNLMEKVLEDYAKANKTHSQKGAHK